MLSLRTGPGIIYQACTVSEPESERSSYPRQSQENIRKRRNPWTSDAQPPFAVKTFCRYHGSHKIASCTIQQWRIQNRFKQLLKLLFAPKLSDYIWKKHAKLPADIEGEWKKSSCRSLSSSKPSKKVELNLWIFPNQMRLSGFVLWVIKKNMTYNIWALGINSMFSFRLTVNQCR